MNFRTAHTCACLLIAGLAGCSPSGTPSLPTFAWETHWDLPAFSDSEDEAFVVEQSQERSQLSDRVFGRVEFRIYRQELPPGTGSTVLTDHVEGKVSNLYPRDHSGYLIADGISALRERDRVLWRVGLGGAVEEIERLPEDLWAPPEGMWSYLPSPDGTEVARIFHREPHGPTSDQPYLEPLTGLSVPPDGVVLTTLDITDGAEVRPPAVVVSETFIIGGLLGLQARWSPDGTLLLTDGLAQTLRLTQSGQLVETETPDCLGSPTTGLISSQGERLWVGYTTGELTLRPTDDLPFGCP